MVGKAIIKEVVRDMEGGQKKKSRRAFFLFAFIIVVIFGFLSYLYGPDLLDSWTENVERAVAVSGIYKQKVQRAH
jgi:Na+-driven multidrug efflux pump